ncbi:hypothetical protein [Listeria innocua]|uniref:hypothetical protein n=1 Tax=Listeria innocua TaxID=1642 RepID=UPI001626B5AE|nr:hypothetical protein [Listeria innocua]MBC1925529.1 hypothetical protein [Listeria innocua]
MIETENNQIRDETSTENKDEKKKKKKKWLLLLLLLALFLGVFYLFFIRDHYVPKQVVSGNFPELAGKKMGADDLKKYAKRAVDTSKVTINVYPDVEVETDGKTGNLWIQNVPTNATAQQAILREKDSNDTLFKSGVLKPGYEVRSIVLDKKLSQGVHKGVMEIEFYDLKTQKKVGQTFVDVKINVK